MAEVRKEKYPLKNLKQNVNSMSHLWEQFWFSQQFCWIFDSSGLLSLIDC